MRISLLSLPLFPHSPRESLAPSDPRANPLSSILSFLSLSIQHLPTVYAPRGLTISECVRAPACKRIDILQSSARTCAPIIHAGGCLSSCPPFVPSAPHSYTHITYTNVKHGFSPQYTRTCIGYNIHAALRAIIQFVNLIVAKGWSAHENTHTHIHRRGKRTWFGVMDELFRYSGRVYIYAGWWWLLPQRKHDVGDITRYRCAEIASSHVRVYEEARECCWFFFFAFNSTM